MQKDAYNNDDNNKNILFKNMYLVYTLCVMYILSLQYAHKCGRDFECVVSFDSQINPCVIIISILHFKYLKPIKYISITLSLLNRITNITQLLCS